MTAKKIPEKYLDLFQKRAFGYFATLMPDGTPQVTPVWVDYDGQYVLVNTARGRLKARNVEQHKQVALTIVDPDNAYRHFEVRGTVVAITANNAEHHIDLMEQKYRDREVYPYHSADQPRILLKIEPEHVSK
jgi:PPOX class probable F420-dependent enzyme